MRKRFFCYSKTLFVDMTTIWRLLKSKFFWKNIGVAILIATVLLIITLFSLNRITHHGEQIEVPNLIGLYEEEARVFLEQKGISLQVIDSVQVRDHKPREIVEQNPAPHTFVKKGRRIYITVNARNQRMLPVPDLRDVSFRQAKAMLESVGFEVENVRYVPSEFSGLVQDIYFNGTRIEAGTRLADGAKVELVVGQTDEGSDLVQVPSFLTLSYAEAQRMLAEAGFVLGAVVNDETITLEDDLNATFVWRQEPKQEEWMPKGKRVDLWLTKDVEKLSADNSLETSEEEIFF